MTVALIFSLFFILAPAGQAEERYTHNAQGRLVISNPLGSNILRKLDLPVLRDAQIQYNRSRRAEARVQSGN